MLETRERGTRRELDSRSTSFEGIILGFVDDDSCLGTVFPDRFISLTIMPMSDLLAGWLWAEGRDAPLAESYRMRKQRSCRDERKIQRGKGRHRLVTLAALETLRTEQLHFN